MDILGLVSNFKWNDDLGIPNPRNRGIVRALTGVILSCLGAAVFILGAFLRLSGVGLVGSLIVMVGCSSLPCAAAEIFIQQDWSEVPRIIRLGLMLAGAVVFVVVLYFLLVASFSLGSL